MVRPEMVPYLAIAAFAGLRAAEIDRLDWSEVNLAERFIELKASKAKTASRRLAPIPDNLLAWLTPYAQPFGPVCNFERSDKQLFYYLAPKAGLKWKRNGLRHSFISYRLAVVKDVGAVSLEAGNSAQMIFKHYRQLVTEKQGNEWFSIKPGESAANVIPLPAAAA
jgi:integrase